MYKGSVVELGASQPPPDAPLREKERYEPWESVVVQWDRGACLGGWLRCLSVGMIGRLVLLISLGVGRG